MTAVASNEKDSVTTDAKAFLSQARRQARVESHASDSEMLIIPAKLTAHSSRQAGTSLQANAYREAKSCLQIGGKEGE